MIKILSRKAFRFKDPNVRILGGDGTINQPDFAKAYFDTIPNEIQNAPEWIKLDPMWGWATSDGDLMEITVQSDSVAHAELKPKLTNAREVAAAAENERTNLVASGTPSNLPPDVKPSAIDPTADSTIPSDPKPGESVLDAGSSTNASVGVGVPAARTQNRRTVTSK